ncbi:MAG: hypothetical protein V4712_15190 [Pseudomonadota bacterium]
MTVALIIILLLPGQPPSAVQIGTMRDLPSCMVAGEGAAHVLARATPGAVVGWSCKPLAAGA